MTATDYIADDHRTYAPSLGGVSRDDAPQAPMTDDPGDDVGLRKARKLFAVGFGALAVLALIAAIFIDESMFIITLFLMVIAAVFRFSKPPTSNLVFSTDLDSGFDDGKPTIALSEMDLKKGWYEH